MQYNKRSVNLLIMPLAPSEALTKAVRSQLSNRGIEEVMVSRGSEMDEVLVDELEDWLNPWLYHGTTIDQVASIFETGLDPDADSWWSESDDPDLHEWSKGYCFLSSSPDVALNYAHEQIDYRGDGEPTILRVRSNSVDAPLEPDFCGNSRTDVCTKERVSMTDAEIEIGEDWVELSQWLSSCPYPL